MADTANVESRKLEDRPLGQEESRRKNVADTTNVESRESEDRLHEGGVQKKERGGYHER